MFLRLSSFPPLKSFQNLYNMIKQDFECGDSTKSAKSILQAACDKDFWEAHYETVIEEFSEYLNVRPLASKTLIQIKERLLECQGIIGHYTLSPRSYEAGIQSLLKILGDKEGDQSSVALLEQIQAAFVKALKEQPDFVKECFNGDLNHGLKQWKEGRISVSSFVQKISYYAHVMEPADYYDRLIDLESALQANSQFYSIKRKIQQLLLKIDPEKVAESREKLCDQGMAHEVISPHSPLEGSSILEDSNSGSSFLKRCLQGISGVVYHIVTHPLETITAGLAAQSAAAMACEVSLTATPTTHPQSTIIPSLSKANELVSRLSTIQTAFFDSQNSVLNFPKPPLLEISRSSLDVPSDVAVPKVLLKSITEFQINTYTNSHQQTPSVATFANGGFVVAWASHGQDGSGYGVYSQRYDVTGVADGNEFRVNTYINDDQAHPSVVRLNNGGFVVTWHSDGQDGSDYGVYGRQYNADGVPIISNEFRVNTYTSNAQAFPSVTILKSGGFVVAWQSYLQDGSSWAAYARQYSVEGVPVNEFLVNTYTNSDQSMPSIAALADGGFVVTWHSYNQDGSGFGVYGQRYDVTGVADGNEFRVNSYTNSDQMYSSVAAFANGGFVVTWQSDGQDGSGFGVYGQRYDVTGVADGNEFRVNSYTNSHQIYPSVAALADGSFVVTWHSYKQDGSGFGVYGQRYDVTGVADGNEFR
ncbi:MAG: hypothetical protein KBD83_08645, partial [Gammaproteobacteria bacterium]|nr:hypothetical protein [Gammaproteobacteria bacterium]